MTAETELLGSRQAERLPHQPQIICLQKLYSSMVRLPD